MALLLLCAPIRVLGEDEGAQLAVWTPKRLHFAYEGFTTHYSCEGLRDQVRKALLALGARKDLEVREGPCTRPAGGPEPYPSLEVTMNVLAPAGGSSGGEQAKTVPAHWRMIDLRLDEDSRGQAGNCELLEHIKHTLLPLFATRNINYRASCIPHQVVPGGTWLRTEVLLPDPMKGQASAEKFRDVMRPISIPAARRGSGIPISSSPGLVY